jgi:hypothetical protein
MNKNPIIKYLDFIFTDLCAWYLGRYHKEMLYPGYLFSINLKRIGKRLGWKKHCVGERTYMRLTQTWFLAEVTDKAAYLENKTTMEYLVDEYLKSIGSNAEKIEVAYLVLDNPLTK